VAILYAQHKQADNIMALMERKGIPYSVKKPVNVLDTPLVQQVIAVIRYLDEERKQPFSGEALLFELMHAPYYEIDPTDIALLSLYIQENRKKDRSLSVWRLLLTNGLLLESLNLKSAKALRRMGTNVEQWQRQQLDLPLPMLVEKIVYESGIVAHITQRKDHIWNVQVLNTFFDYVKDLYNRSQRIKPAELLRILDRMQDENIALPIQRVIQHDNGVHFFTAHGAKGNEFEYVFLIGSTKNFWEGKKGAGNEYKLPDTITQTNEDTEKTYKTEVARRLFYVALTRAKKHLYISYALNDNAGKAIETSVFIDEICPPEERTMQTVPTDELLHHMQWAMEPVPEVQIKLANAQWIERALQQVIMSYTALSKYLRCPLSFYYEQLLRVPFLKNDALAFGSAVHNTLERMFKDMKDKQGVFPEKDAVIGFFRSSLYGEAECFTPVQFERRLEQGETILSEYYDKYINSFSKNVEIEFKIPRYLLDGVPVTGKIDKIELDGDTCTVIDYKTGDPDKSATAMTAQPNEKEPKGGDYWRQMVFYKLLIENYQEKNWKVTKGEFDYIQKGTKSNEFRRIIVPVFPQDETTVRQQLKDSYSRIMNHEFDKGCGKEDCHWCNFARQYELIQQAPDERIEIDDI
jgi:DNA helicase-2/ATP-dependent DNA helicase PcrA